MKARITTYEGISLIDVTDVTVTTHKQLISHAKSILQDTPDADCVKAHIVPSGTCVLILERRGNRVVTRLDEPTGPGGSRPGAGRKPLPDGQQQDTTLSIRITQAMAKTLATIGRNRCKYIRDAITAKLAQDGIQDAPTDTPTPPDKRYHALLRTLPATVSKIDGKTRTEMPLTITKTGPASWRVGYCTYTAADAPCSEREHLIDALEDVRDWCRAHNNRWTV